MTESAIERPFARGVERLGGLCVKLQMAGVAGIPDRLLLLPGGLSLLVEFKSPSGRLSARQRLVIGKLRALGHRVEVVASKERADGLLAELAGRRGGNAPQTAGMAPRSDDSRRQVSQYP